MRRYTFRIILCLFPVVLIAGVSRAGIRLDFDRDNQTYNWQTGFNYMMLKNNRSFRASFEGQSNLIKGNLDRWQENATADFESRVLLLRRFSLMTSGEYTVNGLDRRRVRTSKLAMGLAYRPAKYIEISPMIRADNKKRSELESQLDEQGIGYGCEVALKPIGFNGAVIQAALNYNRINISNIPSQEGGGNLGAVYRFLETDTLAFSFAGNEASKKYYGPGGDIGGITRQIKQERLGGLALSVALPVGLRLNFDGQAHLSRFLYRGGLINDPAEVQKDNFGSGEGYELAITGKAADLARGSVGYRWSNSRQDYQGMNLDQDTDIGELSFHGLVELSPDDSVSLDFLIGVTSFSNPNLGSNRDDWDKRSLLINGRYSHVFSPHLTAGISGGANAFHQINISGMKSANNGRNDTYIMAPYTLWRPWSRLELKQTFDIQANYLTFDYDRKKIATKNRIFRRATSRSDILFVVSNRLEILQSYIYRYEDYGQLIWDDGWQQAVSWDRRRNGIETKLNYFPWEILKLSPFFSWEKTGNYDHSLEIPVETTEPAEIRSLTDEQVKMFFELEMVFDWSFNRRLTAGFSHRLRKFNDRPRETNDYVKVSMEYRF